MKKFTIVALLMVIAGGCGNGERYAPVSGTITLDNQPLADASVLFEPLPVGDLDPPGKSSAGKTDAEGKYTLQSPAGHRNGAVVGRHRVRILMGDRPKFTAEQMDRARQKLLAQQQADGNENPSISDQDLYSYLSETTLVSVQETIPPRYNLATELTFEVPPKGSTQADFAIESK